MLVVTYVAKEVGGSYVSVDALLDKAVVTQQDLLRAYYGTNSFDIGYFEPTIYGVLSKFHLAVEAGLFRPYIWESNNILMFFSGIENFFILTVTIYLLLLFFKVCFKLGILKL